ncbi:flagellar FlbD family protein [Turneriella parva]|uniref:Flagellar FlbD family protein n=1 Tax=Turneriella parva (strain ATCC BAA-1111 / DSM 21527 / NCTC 11395 / H) TaxID=869212 RepID=I4B7N5_TURPD|nr:flagellar FlbD family protein [Turneriella parva]AFM13292.1 flagellar FlbD family protein [Turneriella parva DSM 21527]
MIELSRLNGKVFFLNHNLIEIFEATPDTVIKLTDGTKYVVRESTAEMLEKIVAFNRQIFAEKTRVE